MTNWIVKRGTDLVPVPWRNGLGTTRDVITLTAPDGSLLWQVSIADLVQDAAFSHFPHCDRVFTPIAGDAPPELAFDGGPFVPCPLLVPKRFSGEIPTLSRITAPGRAFNAVFDRRHFAVDVAVAKLADSPGALGQAQAVVVYCLEGLVSVGGLVLRGGDGVVGMDVTQPGAMTGPGTALAVLVRAASM